MASNNKPAGAKQLVAITEIQYHDVESNKIIIVKPGSIFSPKDRDLPDSDETLIENLIRRRAAKFYSAKDKEVNLSAAAAASAATRESGPNADALNTNPSDSGDGLGE